MVSAFRALRATALFMLALAALPAAAAEPPPLDAYGELPNVEDAAISPDGSRIAVIATVDGPRQLLFLDAEMNLLRSATLDDVKTRGVQWVGNEAVLLTMTETVDLGRGFTTDQFEATRVMYVPVDPAQKINMVFADTPGVVKAVFGRFGIRQVGGEWFGYFGGIEMARSSLTNERYVENTRPALFEVRLHDNRARRISNSAQEFYWRDWLVDGNGDVAVTFDMSRDSGSWSLMGPRGKEIASGKDRQGDADLVALGQDGASVIYEVEDSAAEKTRWYELPLSGAGEAVEILADEAVDRIYVDTNSGRLIGYLRGGEKPGPVFFDADKQSAATKVSKAFSRLHHDMIDWTPQFSHMLVRTSGNGDSGTWYMVDIVHLAAGGFGAERPKIDAEHVGKISVVPYTAADGLEMDGILTLPPGREAKNLPVVMFPHGGPTGQDDPVFDWWAQAFASRGYAVFQPNFRGSTNRGESFIRAGNGEWGRKMQSDISDGLAELVEQGIVDPKRACIMGASYGGYAALAGVTLQQGLYRCSVAVAPVSDVKLMYDTDNTESGDSRVVRRSLIEQLGPRSSLNEISPRRFAERADAPILLIHGRDDTVVPFEQSEVMADALKDARKPYRLVDLGSEDHWLSLSVTRKQMLAEAMAFVQEHNPAD
jgi:dipeptidyl aminopeptidase/acylaminoacyl peptidase